MNKFKEAIAVIVIIVIVITSAFGVTALVATAFPKQITLEPDTTIEQRLDVLESAVNRLNANVVAFSQQSDVIILKRETEAIRANQEQMVKVLIELLESR